MTMKWMLGDPYNCWHEKGLEVNHDRKMHGWFPLMNRRWRGIGQHGKFEMQIHWKYVPEEDLKARNDLPPLTAVEQMSLNSEETSLRFADVKLLLDYAPVLFDIERVTVRNIQFHMQDVFPGFEEKRDGTGKREFINIKFVEFHTEFRPKGEDLGITSYQVMYQFVRSISIRIVKAASSAQIGETIGKMTVSSINQVVGSWKHALTGRLGRLKNVARPFGGGKSSPN